LDIADREHADALCVAYRKASLTVSDKRALHGMVHFPHGCQRLQVQIQVPTMPQAEHHPPAEAVDQLPLKAPKTHSDLFTV
jgi:hypothetical protein